RMPPAVVCVLLLSFLLPSGLPRAGAASVPVRRLDISPSSFTLNGKSTRQQLIVTLLTDGAADRTRSATFQSETPAVVQVSATGLVTSAGSGTGTILVRSDDLQARLSVKVTQGEDHLPATFERNILPILARAGCNSGPCHGKARGQNGFQLSLLGF